VWEKKGEYEKALKDYTEAVRLDPKDADVLSARAWLRATCPDEKYRDGRAAVRDAKTACELTGWRTAYVVGTLAAAHAEAGEFDQAVEYIKRALGDKQYEKESGETGRKMLKLFEQGKPYREEPPKNP
jgi:tetratricopeptide (TPR) repeat protein